MTEGGDANPLERWLADIEAELLESAMPGDLADSFDSNPWKHREISRTALTEAQRDFLIALEQLPTIGNSRIAGLDHFASGESDSAAQEPDAQEPDAHEPDASGLEDGSDR